MSDVNMDMPAPPTALRTPPPGPQDYTPPTTATAPAHEPGRNVATVSPPPFKRPFTEDVVKVLEQLMEKAKAGHINCIAYCCAEGPLQGYNGFSGMIDCFQQVHYQMHHCAKRLMDRLDLLAAPQRNTDAPANMWAYDVSTEPIGHDFIAWAVNVKMNQAREGVPGPTKICFLRRQDEAQLGYIDADYREAFFNSVMKPALDVLDFVFDPEARNGRRLDHYTYREITEASRRGEAVPRVIPPQINMNEIRKELEGGPAPVIIQLREHRYWDHRNSDIAVWTKVADWLEARGERVIFVRDYAKADEPIEGYKVHHKAGKDLKTRVALYEQAKCNLFVSHGNQSMALFGSKPWLMWVNVSEEEKQGYLQNTPNWWPIHHGINLKEQFPWCDKHYQRIVWGHPTFESITSEFERMFPAVVAEAAE